MTPEPERKVIELADGITMPFREIPPGEFRMGQRGESENEEPVHLVKITRAFWMAETPVTQEQFALWTGAESVKHKNEFAGRAKNPAENMDWNEAMAFCRWFTEQYRGQFPEGMKLATLPSEAQWEYACRAGTDTEYHTGDGDAALAEAGWFGEKWGSGSTHPVAEKARNDFWLHDMHGNVWEWCADRWDEHAYRKRVDGWIADAAMEVETTGAAGENPRRVLRGGSWFGPARSCRAAFRLRFEPGYRSRIYGFRLVLVPGPVAQPERGAPEKEKATGAGGEGSGGSGKRKDAAQRPKNFLRK